MKVAVAAGDRVRAGDTLVAIEAMKMEHEVQASAAGTVTEVHVDGGRAGGVGPPARGRSTARRDRRVSGLAAVDADADVLRIANCSGFYGDRLAAPRELRRRWSRSTS